MKKDISIPKVKDVGVAIIREKDKNEWVWRAYLLNLNNCMIKDVLVSTRGYGTINDKKKKTSSFSHYLGDIEKQSYKLIEHISEETFVLSNEFFVTFYINGVIHDKKYIFLPETIQKNNFTTIPILNQKGVLIK